MIYDPLRTCEANYDVKWQRTPAFARGCYWCIYWGFGP